MIIDGFNRVHDYLRISLTDNCNLRCFYCMPEEEYNFTPASRLMQADEIYKLAKVFTDNGVRKIRLTGGEPLVRKDAAAIIHSLSTLPVELTLTTNGARLHEFADILTAAGVRSLNISLDTLQADKFLFITKRDLFLQVKKNIDLMISRGVHVKVNVVAMKGLNDTEICDFVEWTRLTPVHVRFIEFMPFSGNRWTSNKVLSLQEILTIIGAEYDYLPLKGGAHDTAKGFIVPGHAGTFAVISTMTAPFCGTCNRMRLTADGKLKNCLFSKEETDLLTALRNGQEVLPLIMNSIGSKARELGGQFAASLQTVQAETIENRSMITIGG
ncbi:MAG TPA: GTP 3',8-cyclase MoaA [Chitinophaga sp.]|nr:GTP 3',8-cyclase MoaA [Chitinophaga sp.]